MNVQKNNSRAGAIGLIIFALIALAVFGAGVWLLYTVSTKESSVPKQARETKVDSEISAIKRELQRVRQEWISGEQKDKVIAELQKIQVRLQKLGERVSPEAKKRFQDLTDNMDELIAGMKEKLGNLGQRFDTLIDNLGYDFRKKKEEDKNVKQDLEEK